MSRPLLEFPVDDDSGVGLARQRAREIAAALGLDTYGQVRLATAVSEIVRNAWVHASGARVAFELDDGPPCRLVCRVTDTGASTSGARAGEARGAGARRHEKSGTVHGLEIARRLADTFETDPADGPGTAVTMRFGLGAGTCDRASIDALLASLPRSAARDEAAQLRETNRALLASLARAESAVASREELLAIVSHDLRNPLGAIVTSADALEFAQVDGPGGEFVEEMRSLILSSAGQMEKLIGDLLDLASLDAGALAIDADRQDAREIVIACARELGPVAVRRGQSVVHGEAAGPELLCDRGRVLQVLSNLVGNAIKFGERGGRVVVEASRDGERARFSVLDSGRGMSPDELERLFDRHWQRDASDRRGIGLGMSIVRAIVDAHGGQIEVDSELGIGTCVRVWLPLAGPDPVR